VKLVDFPISELEDWLPNIWDMLLEACKRSSGKYQPMDIVREVYAKRMQLWNAIDDNIIKAICVTEICTYPHTKVLRILAATGDDAETWSPLIIKLEEWAKELGCEWCEPIVRPGWKKILKDLGYKEQHVILEKKL
jgi:hypothetical protein